MLIGEGVGLLKDHTNFLRSQVTSTSLAKNILSVKGDLAIDANAGHQVLHAVQRFQKGAFFRSRTAR